MQSFSPIVSIQEDSIVTNEFSSKKPTTLLLRTNRPYLYNRWIRNNRLRLKNEKLRKRQQSSCRIAFYSFWLCVSACIMIIIIYRFTDECSLTIDEQQFSIKCLRHCLFLTAICTSFLGCTGVIFGAYRYFRLQTHKFLYDNQHQSHLTNINGLSSMNISIVPSHQTSNHDDENSNTTVISSLTNTSLRYKIPPFNYEELPIESNPLRISKSAYINNNTNKSILFSSSNSTLSSPQSIFSRTRSFNTNVNNNKSKMTSTVENTCTSKSVSYATSISGIDIWKKQPRLL